LSISAMPRFTRLLPVTLFADEPASLLTSGVDTKTPMGR
jgi:hypothetical protein